MIIEQGPAPAAADRAPRTSARTGSSIPGSLGCGGGSQPSQYRDHLNYWASHGFVVEAHVSSGNAKDHTAVLDWFIKEDTRQGSPYFGKLDTTKIALGGHSMGSVATFAAASDPRVTTTIHVAGGSFDGNGYRTLKKPTAYIAGANDNLATGNAERDYKNTNNVPVFFTVMTGVDHIQAARAGLAPVTAWLRWHLGGEEERKARSSSRAATSAWASPVAEQGWE